MANILIVEDDQETASLLRFALERRAHIVEHAATAAAGIALLDSFTPHIIILDIVLPGMNGEDFLALLRRRPEHKSTRVIVYTGHPEKIDFKTIVALGVNEILVKATTDIDRVIALVEN